MRFFYDILRKKHGTLLYCGLRQWASLSMGLVLRFSQTDGIDSVRCISILSDFLIFLSYYAWTLMRYWLLFTFLLNVQSPIVNRVFYKRQRKLIDVITEPRRGYGFKYFLSCIFKILSWIYKISSCIFKILSWIFKISISNIQVSYLEYTRYYLVYSR